MENNITLSSVITLTFSFTLLYSKLLELLELNGNQGEKQCRWIKEINKYNLVIVNILIVHNNLFTCRTEIYGVKMGLVTTGYASYTHVLRF